jgi:hypothetical protein
MIDTIMLVFVFFMVLGLFMMNLITNKNIKMILRGMNELSQKQDEQRQTLLIVYRWLAATYGRRKGA